MMERPRPQSKVTLEDLIRLKRAERPPQEFWAEFESQLRHKQLAAIVDKRPWWRRFSIANLAKLSVPVGATAIVALTLTTFRERFHATPPVNATVAAAASFTHDSLVAPDVSSVADNGIAASILSAAQIDADASAKREAKLSTPARVHEELAVAGSADEVLVSRAEKETSLAQVILGLEDDVTVVQPRFEEPVLVASVADTNAITAGSGNLGGTETASLESFASSIDARRARLLVSVDSYENTSRKDNSRVARTRDRIASRLNEQALSDSIRRLGLNGDSVSIKF